MAKKKRPVRGSGFSVTLPTEPLAGAAKDTPIMAVMVQEAGAQVLEFEVKVGQSISRFRVGGKTEAFMERVGPAPDSDLFMDADQWNVEPVTVEYEHALAGKETIFLARGSASPSTRSSAALEDHRAKLGVAWDAERDRPGIFSGLERIS